MVNKTPVDYSNRPNKSIVRNKILKLIERYFHPAGSNHEDISFITLSGYQFIDSKSYYRRFGLQNIYSIENIESLFTRANFNKPYEFIDITKGTLIDFITEKSEKVIDTLKIINLDYESRLKNDIFYDLQSLIASNYLNNECLLFITFNIQYNKFFNINLLPDAIQEVISDDINSEESFKEWLSSYFPKIILNLVQEKYDKSKSVVEIMKTYYKDSVYMAIFGFYIKNHVSNEDFLSSISLETLSLPPLTFLEENYIRNNYQSKTEEEIADRLGLDIETIIEYIKYT